MKIALDLDDTLVDTFPVLHGWIENLEGAPIGEPMLSQYVLSNDRKRADEIVARFFALGADAAIGPAPGARAACARLSALGFELIVVTARNASVARQTADCVERLFPATFRDIHCIGRESDPENDKTLVLQTAGAKIFIDDHLPHVSRAHEAGIASILFGDLPWNRGKHWANRALDWSSALALIEGL